MLRTHTCGELRAAHEGQEVSLCGWVQNRRDHGEVLFVDVRDRYGVTQVVVDSDLTADARADADRARLEWVVRATGTVRKRVSVNADRDTGEIEVLVSSFEVLSAAEPLPISVSGKERTSEDLALKYRYLEMRRPELRHALETRARTNAVLRDEMIQNGFIEVETPSLLRSTPEGARDYLVPSRVHPGTFYALLQSPQILKQLTMIGGLDRYWQIVRCFRDEDLRADRQPEFTQLDVEMTFVEAADVQLVAEDLVHRLILEIAGVDVPRPFPRLTYAEAQSRYGSDKPDLRFELPVHDVTEQVRASGFAVFSRAVEAGGLVRALAVPPANKMTRKQLDGLPAVVLDRGARGVAWCRIGEDDWSGSAARHIGPDERLALIEATGAQAGGLLLFLAGPESVVVPASGDLRNHLGALFGLIEPGVFAPCWIDAFPLFEKHAETGALAPAHHAFTAPVPEDLALLETDPGAVRAQAYDLALNGQELLGGSIRIHDLDVQRRVLAAIGMDAEEAQARFGFLLDALKYGAPPHGGFAMGTDRLVAILLGLTQIRDVIAFPKTTSATDLMTGAPAAVDAEQMDELGLRWVDAQA